MQRATLAVLFLSLLLLGCVQQIPPADPLVLQCTQSFEACKEVFIAKTIGSVTVLKQEKINDSVTAKEFYNTWKGPLQMGFDYDFSQDSHPSAENYLPLVLFALRASESSGTYHFVVICDKSGHLLSASKAALQCGK